MEAVKLDEDDNAIKKIKLSFPLFENITSNIFHIKIMLQAINPLLNRTGRAHVTAPQPTQPTDKQQLEWIALEIEDIRREMEEVKARSLKVNDKHSAGHTPKDFEYVLHCMMEHNAGVLPKSSLLAMAAASRTVFHMLSPTISEFSFVFPFNGDIFCMYNPAILCEVPTLDYAFPSRNSHTWKNNNRQKDITCGNL